ncbi:hypothetical protein [Delftia tsuruhatensis]|uniref:hypothetical protein n=1 Tax=Delftia tsuruhatensis TaxID=180282 RepID=UPI0028AD5B69|nr:hypothetical protein [Delftia tsuruhatensis]
MTSSVQIGDAASASYTYDANGNRLTQAQTKGAVTSTTSYHWNAQDQLIRVDQDYGSGAQTLAQYRYNAGNLRAEKFLSNAGLNKATQGRAATYSPLAYERIQWDGLHARRSFEISGADNRQTLHSDTDAAVLAGNTAPWLFNRTQYANGLQVACTRRASQLPITCFQGYALRRPSSRVRNCQQRSHLWPA